MALLDPDRLFPPEPAVRDLARALYGEVRDLPIISPHGHTDPRWYAENAPFPDPAQLFVVPDHYVFRMLCSQGVPLADLGVPARRRRPDRDRRARDLAALRRELPPVARHARRGSGSTIPSRRCSASTTPPVRRDRRRRLRPYRRLPRPARSSCPRALLRALRHRGDRDHRQRARRPALAPDDPRLRLERPRRHRLPARCGRRSRVRRLRRQRRPARRDHRLRHRDLGGLPRRPPRSGAPSSRRSAPPAPTTATRPPAPRTCRRPRPRRSSPRRSPARRRPRRPTPSAARC